MAGKTHRAAHDAFTHAYQRALLCIAQVHFGTEGHRDPGAVHKATIGARSVVVPAAPPMRLLVDVQYRIVAADHANALWVVQLEQYVYTLANADDAEIFAYYWHPNGGSWITWPHMHLGPALGRLPSAAMAARFPTGPVAVQDVISLAIRWFGATPRQHDWERTLRETRQLFAALHPMSQ